MNEEIEYSDNLMPTDGDLFAIAQEAENDYEESTEKAMVVGSYPILDELLTWFDTEIEFANDIYSLDPKSSVPLDSQIIARKELKSMLLASKSRLEVLKDAHIKR